MAFNASATSTNGGTATVTIPGIQNFIVKIYSVDGWTSGGSAQVTVTEAGTTRWLSPANWIGGSLTTKNWTPSPLLANSPGNAMTISASGQGAMNTVTINVQADNN